MPTDAPDRSTPSPLPATVGIAAWILPGAGYWLLGHRARGVTVGVSIVLLLFMGILIGGARVIEVPTYDHYGKSVVGTDLTDEIRGKPWSIAQFMTGPIGLAAGALSVYASRPYATPEPPGPGDAPDAVNAVRLSPGSESHSRVNEIAVLYTAVAGMLNLLVIIDSIHRAGKNLEAA